MAFSDAETQ